MPYVRKYKKAVTSALKKRYVKKKSGNYKYSKIAKDLAMVKRQLNVEHKHLDFKFGSGQTTTAQYPTKTTPIIIPLPVPTRGTAYNQRVGNQIRVVHMTTKLEFLFGNNTDLIQRSSARAQIIFAKSGDDIPDITKLYDTDANGHYTPMSFCNTQEYKKYCWIKSLDHKKSYTQPTNRYPASSQTGYVVDPKSSPGSDINVASTDYTPVSLNMAPFYSNKSAKVSIRMFFKNLDDETVEQMKPYLVLRSDVIDSATDYDPIAVTGIIRMTYVDN